MASKPTTQYSRAMKAVRAEEKAKERNVGARRQRNAVGGAKCGAKKHEGGTCRMAAGHGTTHPGVGHCKYHGGNTPNHSKAAAKKIAVFMGAPKEINPLDAIIWCIKMTAGEIDFYTEQLGLIVDENKWIENTVVGTQMNIFARERAAAQERLVNFSKIAVSLGLTERAVKLAEQYGNTIARLIKGVLDELMPYISPEGIALIPTIVRKHLLIAEQGQSALNSFAATQTAIEA